MEPQNAVLHTANVMRKSIGQRLRYLGLPEIIYQLDGLTGLRCGAPPKKLMADSRAGWRKPVRNWRIKSQTVGDAQSGPSIWTWIVPLLAGTAVYVVFAEKLELQPSHVVWSEELLEVAPAVMLMLLFEVFVLFPLNILFARRQLDRPLFFLAVSTLIWIAASVLILRGTNALAQGDLWVDASVIVPGIVVAAVYRLMIVYRLPRS